MYSSSLCKCFCRRRLIHTVSSPAACVVHCCPHEVHDTEWMYGSVLILRATGLHNQCTSLFSTPSCPCSQSRRFFNVGVERDNIPVFKKKILTLTGLKYTLLSVCTLQHSSFTFLPSLTDSFTQPGVTSFSRTVGEELVVVSRSL